MSAVVIVPENSDGRPVISINRARAEIGWRDLQTKKDAEEVVTGEVVDHNKGGLIVSVDGVRGFVPLSQIVELRRGGSEEEVEEKLRSMRGQTLYLKVIEMNRRRNRLILSERAAAQERRAQQKDRLLAELQAGEIRHGRVSSLTDFGAFVDLGGADGLIHLSELSWGQVQHPVQVLRVGQEVDVRVVGVDRENKKIAPQPEAGRGKPLDAHRAASTTSAIRCRPRSPSWPSSARSPSSSRASRAWCTSPSSATSASRTRSRWCARARTSSCGSSRSIRSGIASGLSLRQAEDARRVRLTGGGFEAWDRRHVVRVRRLGDRRRQRRRRRRRARRGRRRA